MMAANGIVWLSWRNMAYDSMFMALAQGEGWSQFGEAFKVKTLELQELFPQHFD